MNAPLEVKLTPLSINFGFLMYLIYPSDNEVIDSFNCKLENVRI